VPAGGGVIGTLEAEGDRFVLRFERTLPAPPVRVWQALTDEEDLVTWFPVAIEGDRSTGAPLRMVFRSGEGPSLDGEVLDADEAHVLALRWGEETLCFELSAAEGGCHLTFVDTFGDGGTAARGAAGWHLCLDALTARLRGDPPAPQSERWQAVYDGYVERFGPGHASAPIPHGK